MGCFCRNQLPRTDETFVQPPRTEPDEDRKEDEDPPPPLLEAVGRYLATRWLPAPTPWSPDPAWLDIPWPDNPLPPENLSVLSNLAFAQRLVQDTFALDLLDDPVPTRLVRIVATLNRRTEQLADLERDERPWSSLLNTLNQVEQVEKATRSRLLQSRTAPSVRTSLALWRPTLLKVNALAPLVAIGQMFRLDWSDAAVTEKLAARVRRLARVELPPLADPSLVSRLLTRFDAIDRLKRGLGADPRPHPFERVRAALHRRAEQAVAQLPPETRLQDDELVGMPPLEPNLGYVLNAPTIRLARLITPRTLERLNWKVPPPERLSLVTAGLPVAHLCATLSRLEQDPVRATPCARDCDAATALRATGTPPPPGGAATAKPGSGTGAAPAG